MYVKYTKRMNRKFYFFNYIRKDINLPEKMPVENEILHSTLTT